MVVVEDHSIGVKLREAIEKLLLRMWWCNRPSMDRVLSIAPRLSYRLKKIKILLFNVSLKVKRSETHLWQEEPFS